MTAERPDDDPTHALDDFVRRMRPAAAPAPAAMPDLSALDAALMPGRHAAADRDEAGGGKPRAATHWQAGEFEDVVDISSLRRHARPSVDNHAPELLMPFVDLVAETAQAGLLPGIELPAVDAPQPTDMLALDSSLQQAGQRAAQRWQADADAAALPAWQPNPQTLQLRPVHNPRLRSQWLPGAWVGALRQVLDSRTEFVNAGAGGKGMPVVETYAPLLLLLLWPPQRIDQPLLGRWPQRVWLSALPLEQALLSLLASVPDMAPLWLIDKPEQVDWALAAEISLHHAPALRPFQIEGLREFIAAEREASFGRINSAYLAQAGQGAVLQT